MPTNWKSLRKAVFARAGGRCEFVDPILKRRCVGKGAVVDHILNKARGGDHHLSNLQLLCQHHSDIKTAMERKLGGKRSTRRP